MEENVWDQTFVLALLVGVGKDATHVRVIFEISLKMLKPTSFVGT
jgi:hypothetical protein